MMRLFSTNLLLLLVVPATVTGRAILGVDLGSLYMKVALVKSGSPLEIVTNLHSKRKTEQMILFDQSQRLYGADASALLARKSHQTPAAMSLMLGRDEQHPVVQVLAERHFPIQPRYNESRAGVSLLVDGVDFTPEELVAMVLTHAVDISVAYSHEHGTKIAPPKDVVLTVPSYSTQHERRALLDAAALADLNVLTLLDECTAAALHYAMDKKFEDNEQLLLFYNMGASALQVSLIRFFAYDQPQKYGKPKTVPAMEVLAKAWDTTLGGQAFDHLLVELLADQFNAAWAKSGRGGPGKDIRTASPRAMTKLRIQANKIKHVLSANTEIPVYMESVYDDVSLSTHVSREQLEILGEDLFRRAVDPVAVALNIANKTMDDLTGIELIGGGMRIPRIQAEINKVLGGKMELGMHINADESMALGAAFAGANISTAFRVRSVGLTDVNPFPMAVTLKDSTPNPEAPAEEQWNKHAVIFNSFGKLGVKKTIAFTHDRDVHCSLDYEPNEILPPGTNPALERYVIGGIASFAEEMKAKGLGKPKVSLQFELGIAGIAALVKAEAAVEETYTVEEEIEVDDDEAAAADSASASGAQAEAAPAVDAAEGEKEAPKEGEEAEKPAEDTENETATADGENATKKPEEKPKKKVKVQKEKKRTHKQPLTVQPYHEGRIQPHTGDQLIASKNKLLEMALRDKERMMLEESRNKVESYIYRIKNKLEDDAEVIGVVTTEEQREAVRKLAVDAEDWLYDEGYSADLATMEDKYAELSVPFEFVMLRVSEMTARPAAMEALKKKLVDVEQLMVKWAEDRPQVTEEERVSVLEKVEEVRKWIVDMEEAQSKKQPHEDPAFFSEDVPKQTSSIEALVLKLSKRPKPKPPKPEKNETESATNDTATESGGEGAAAGDSTTAEEGEAAAGTETATEGEDTATATGQEAEADAAASSSEEKLEDEL